MANFNPATINQLLQQTTSQVDGLSQSLTEDKLNSQKSELVVGSVGSNVDYSRVYGELEILIKSAKDSLEIINAIDPDSTNPQTVAAVATLINSIKGLVAEFTVIHRMNIKHQHNIELESIKQQNRLDTLERRQELKNNTIHSGQSDQSSGDYTVINTLPYSNDLMIEFEEFLKQKGLA